MSEITRGVIGMPLEMAMESELSRRQFHSIGMTCFVTSTASPPSVTPCSSA
jgi:hypothetical protein